MSHLNTMNGIAPACTMCAEYDQCVCVNGYTDKDDSGRGAVRNSKRKHDDYLRKCLVFVHWAASEQLLSAQNVWHMEIDAFASIDQIVCWFMCCCYLCLPSVFIIICVIYYLVEKSYTSHAHKNVCHFIYLSFVCR